jgi:hypothetical protein
MSNYKLLYSIIFAFLSIFSVTGQKINGNYNYKTSCVDVESDGSQTLLAWGKGRNRTDAVEQAKKNAVSDILFVGILDGNSVCTKRPLLPEVNARENYEDYFNAFFKDGGDFMKYVSLKDERIGDHIFRDKKKSSNGINLSVVVRVLMPELKVQLKKDGILKK